VQQVTLTVSDPWDFVSESGGNIFTAEVKGEGEGGSLLLHFAEPVRWHGCDWQWFVAAPSSGDTCSLYGLTDSQAAGDAWLAAASDWRGETPSARADLAR